jgi:hypothetical protein
MQTMAMPQVQEQALLKHLRNILPFPVAFKVT